MFAFVFSGIGEEVERARKTEERFCLREMTYEECCTRPSFHAKKTPEGAKQTLAESHTGARESGPARSGDGSTQAAFIHLGWPMS